MFHPPHPIVASRPLCGAVWRQLSLLAPQLVAELSSAELAGTSSECIAKLRQQQQDLQAIGCGRGVGDGIGCLDRLNGFNGSEMVEVASVLRRLRISWISIRASASLSSRGLAWSTPTRLWMFQSARSVMAVSRTLRVCLSMALGPCLVKERRWGKSQAPGMIPRQSVHESLTLCLKVVESLIPTVRG